jgi:hypothetical protein
LRSAHRGKADIPPQAKEVSALLVVIQLVLRSRASLAAEILVLRHQLNIQRRHLPKRLILGALDRLIFVGLYRLVPTILGALALVKPETVSGANADISDGVLLS